MTKSRADLTPDEWASIGASLGPHVLDLGCGKRPKPGFLGVDSRISVRPSVVANLEQTLPFADASIGMIWTDQTLEHIHNLIPLMNECWRVLIEGGVIWIGVPRFPEPESVIDPTHVRFFVPGTFDYFTNPENDKFDYGILPWRKVSVETPAWGVVAVLQKRPVGR